MGLALKLGAGVLGTDDLAEVKVFIENNLSDIGQDVKGMEVRSGYFILSPTPPYVS